LDHCPQEKLLEDLKMEVIKWQEAGEQVILLGNMNDDVNAPILQKFCQDLHLVEAILTLHGKSPHPTHQHGSKAIDGIYILRSLLQDAHGGFLAFGEVMHSDHRAVWLDIQAEAVGMIQQETISCLVCCQLKCQDPQIVTKYTKELSNTIATQDGLNKVEALYAVAQTTEWTSLHLDQYNALDNDLAQAKLKAEQCCRKLCMGCTPWTPALMQAIQRIQYWKGIAKCSHGGTISRTVLKQQASKGQLKFSSEHWKMPSSAIHQKIKLAYDDYYTIKAQADCQDTWLRQLINAILAAKDIPKAWLWKQICQNKAAQKLSRQIKRIFHHDNSRMGLTQVNMPDPSNQEGRVTVYDKPTSERACLK